MPACHRHLARLMDLLHPHTLDHLRQSPHPRLVHFHIASSVSFATIQRSLRSDASPQHLCALSQPWLTQPHTRCGLPSVYRDGFLTLPGLFDSLLFLYFRVIILLLLASSSSLVGLRACLDSSCAPSRFIFLSSAPLRMFYLSCLRSPCARACAITYI